MLEDGQQLPCLEAFGWCADCESLVVMEHIYPLEVMMKRLSELENCGLNDVQCQEDARLFREDVGELVARRIDFVHKYVEWRRTRESPPRCLRCGSTHVTRVKSMSEFEHPGCGGVFRKDQSYHFIEASYQLFSSEGL